MVVRAVLLLSLLLGGCATSSSFSTTVPPLPSGRVYLASWPRTFPSDCSMGEVPSESPTAGTVLCVVTGHGVEGTLEGSNGCTSIALDGTGDRKTLIWPPGFSAQFDPLIVFDHRGAEVAKGGDFVSADASEPSDATLNPCGGDAIDVSSMRSTSVKP